MNSICDPNTIIFIIDPVHFLLCARRTCLYFLTSAIGCYCVPRIWRSVCVYCVGCVCQFRLMIQIFGGVYNNYDAFPGRGCVYCLYSSNFHLHRMRMFAYAFGSMKFLCSKLGSSTKCLSSLMSANLVILVWRSLGKSIIFCEIHLINTIFACLNQMLTIIIRAMAALSLSFCM